MHEIWHGRRAHWVKYKNSNNSDLHTKVGHTLNNNIITFIQLLAWQLRGIDGHYGISVLLRDVRDILPVTVSPGRFP